MNPNEPVDLLEECLRDIWAGKTPEEVVSARGAEAESLRPLLETAARARSLSQQTPIPSGVQARSRARTLAAAGRVAAPRPLSFLRLRLSTASLALVAVLVIASMVGSGFASAQSLPGDALYPVKLAVERARLSMVQDTASRLTLEEDFDRERAEETLELVRIGRSQEMNFAGVLESEPGEPFEVSGLHLVLTPEQEKLAQSYLGMYVEVRGKSTGEGVLVESIQARIFVLSGVLQPAQTGGWTIGGVPVLLTPLTRLEVPAEPGRNVYATVIRMDNDELLALILSGTPQIATYLPPTSEVDEDEHPSGSESDDDGDHQEANATQPASQEHEEKIVTPQPDGNPPAGSQDSSESDQTGDDHKEDEHDGDGDHDKDD